MNWEKVKFGDFCTVTSSKRFHLSDRCDSGIPFYCSKEIIQKHHGQDVTECDYIKEESYEDVKKRFGVPQAGDLLITTRGTYGIPYIYKQDDLFYFADGNLTWLKDFKENISVSFLYYWILSHEGQKKIDAIAKGTAQKAVPIAMIKGIEISLPPFPTQQKIASILSAYDNLIENNQKQIKLLEEAAQRLYKEWFVDLRFPGFESTEIVDGVPMGWKKTTIGEETEVKRGGSPRPIQDYLTEDGLNWLKISDATANNNPFIYTIKEKIRPEGLKKTVYLKSESLILSNSATPGIPRILKVDSCIHDGWLYFPNLTLSNEYMYHLFLQIREDLVSKATGAVFTNLKTDILKKYVFIKPELKILERFQVIVKPIFENIDSLSKQNLLLSESRDRLLPKLMSGEMEV